MGHKDFDAARRAYGDSNVPLVTFTLARETFTVLPDPTLGDTFDVADVPDLKVEHFDSGNVAHIEIIRGLCKFIRRMLPPEDRGRWDAALYGVPVSHQMVVIEIAEYIAAEVIARPTEPPANSFAGREKTGQTSSAEPAGESDSS